MKGALFFMLAVTLFGQTDLSTSQIKPAKPSSTPAIQFFLPGTGFVLVTLDSSLVLNGAVLSSVAPQGPAGPQGPQGIQGVPGPQGIPGTSPNFVDAETPAGLINGANLVFTLANSPALSSLHLYRNGLRQRLGLDYTVSGSSISFLAVAVPQVGDLLLADYRF